MGKLTKKIKEKPIKITHERFCSESLSKIW